MMTVCDDDDEEERSAALRAREREGDDTKRLAQNTHLPLDLVLRVIAHLPSAALFDFRRLCKAAHPHALLALAHRPFFVLQKEPPSSLCFLLPLNSRPSPPLSCSFDIAKPSFRLFLASRNLLCLHRHYPLLFDICVCNIFPKWKAVLPPLVHPSFAPRINRHVFAEDSETAQLRIVGFHVVQPTIETHEEESVSPGYRIFVASTIYLRVFDSRVNEWSGPVYFPPHLLTQSSHYHRGVPTLKSKYPMGFTTSDGNLILTFSFSLRAVFNYKDQSFHAMELGFHPDLEVAGYPATADVDTSFTLRIRLPHVKECARSSPGQGLVLEELCKSEFDSPNYGSFTSDSIRGMPHSHQYSRHLLRSFCHAYQGKVYALVMERYEMRCITEIPDSDAPPRLSSKCKGKKWHDASPENIEKCLQPGEDMTIDCARLCRACSSRKLTLYSARIDTTNWTMKVLSEADASAFLEVFDEKGGTLLFMSN